MDASDSEKIKPMTTWDTFRIEFDDDGTLRQRGTQGWREPVCPECGEGVQYVLDMASWKHMEDGSFAVCHARCVWKRGGFITEAERAWPDDIDDE
jgi:hypothetical protein